MSISQCSEFICLRRSHKQTDYSALSIVYASLQLYHGKDRQAVILDDWQKILEAIPGIISIRGIDRSYALGVNIITTSRKGFLNRFEQPCPFRTSAKCCGVGKRDCTTSFIRFNRSQTNNRHSAYAH